MGPSDIEQELKWKIELEHEENVKQQEKIKQAGRDLEDLKLKVKESGVNYVFSMIMC